MKTVDDNFLIEIYFSGGGNITNNAGTLISFVGKSTENFTDLNCNGVWDNAESFTDCNEDQTICEGNLNWLDEFGNDEYDIGENYDDLNKNNMYDAAEDLFDENEDGLWDENLSDSEFIILAISDDPSTDNVLSIYINNQREEIEIIGSDFSNSNEFHLLQIFSSEDGISFYLDNKNIYSSSEDIMLQGASMIIGALGNNSGMSNFWNGHIDEIRLWRNPLTDDLRSMHYETSGKLVESMQDEIICDLIGIWTFNYNEPKYEIKDEKCYFTNSLDENTCNYESCSSLNIDGTIFTIPGSEVSFSQKEF